MDCQNDESILTVDENDECFFHIIVKKRKNLDRNLFINHVSPVNHNNIHLEHTLYQLLPDVID